MSQQGCIHYITCAADVNGKSMRGCICKMTLCIVHGHFIKVKKWQTFFCNWVISDDNTDPFPSMGPIFCWTLPIMVDLCSWCLALMVQEHVHDFSTDYERVLTIGRILLQHDIFWSWFLGLKFWCYPLRIPQGNRIWPIFKRVTILRLAIFWQWCKHTG